jgi:hypothetical protein
VGHADRSRLDNALGLDAQSRRVRLPSAGRGSDSDTDANTYGYCDSNSYRDPNSYGYTDADFHAQTDADAEVIANTKASSYSSAPSITPDIEH